MKLFQLVKEISSGAYDSAFIKIYGIDCDIHETRARYLKAAENFIFLYGELLSSDDDVCIFSVPGRSEISGNHTDHNNGKVIAASISLDIIAVAAKNEKNEIRVKSEGFPEDIVDLSDVSSVRNDEFFKASAIIRGACDGFSKSGFNYGAFYAYTTSNVLKGSGLSSSAAFENMIGNILNHFYNDSKIDNIEIAKISQYAENIHFGKPCGLMDQIACAVGGFVSIDFCDPKKPLVEKLDFDLSSHGYSLCIINTGGNHADLNSEYAAIPSEMKSVAQYFGKEYLRQVKKQEVLSNVSSLRKVCGDRAVLRALHFFNENVRVEKAVLCLKADDINGLLENITKSGISSATMLQNAFAPKSVQEQGIPLALAVAEEVLDEKPGTAYRVHGGGFAGTIQAFVPNEFVTEIKKIMTDTFGEGNTYVLKVRPYGAVMLDKMI